MNSNDTFSNHHVHGWLMDVPGYPENFQHNNTAETRDTINSKERPTSLLSINSEDSVNLDELINANFTTDMDDEQDLPDLSSLDLLDDSNEDFWKLDNFLNQLISPGKMLPSKYGSNRSNYDLTSSEDDDFLFDSNNTSLDDLEDSFYNNNNKAIEHDFLNDLNFDCDTTTQKQPTLLQVPYSPKSQISSSPTNNQQRINRSNSTSSENSFSSLSTITQRHVYPTASTSITSSRSTITTSHLPCSSSTRTNDYISQHRSTSTRPQLPTSLLETTTNTTPSLLPSRSHIGLARHATHIPSPSSTRKSLIPSTTLPAGNTPSRTKSLAHKRSTGSLTTSSRIGQPNNRASHIPTARSTTSLGISSIFSTTTVAPIKHQQQRQQYERPNTSMSVKAPSIATSGGLRRAPSTMIPSKSTNTTTATGLRRMQSTSARSLYSKS